MTAMNTDQYTEDYVGQMDHAGRRDDGSTRERISEHAEAIKDDLRAVRDDAAALAGTAGSCVQSEAERVAEAARAGGERVAEVAKAGGEKAQEAHEAFCGTVKRHPTASVVAAVGVGVILGRLIAGR